MSTDAQCGLNTVMWPPPLSREERQVKVLWCYVGKLWRESLWQVVSRACSFFSLLRDLRDLGCISVTCVQLNLTAKEGCWNGGKQMMKGLGNVTQ